MRPQDLGDPSMELPSVAPLQAEQPRTTSVSTPPSPARLSRAKPLAPPSDGRVLCFDLENRPLAYWYDGQTTSEITAFGWKWVDESDVHTLILRSDQSYIYDGHHAIPYVEAHVRFRDILITAGVVYGHNIRRHDLPMLNAWLLRQQLPPLPKMQTTDTLRDYPKRNGLSASLENLATMYHLDGDKYAMPQPAWEKANQLHPDGTEQARLRVTSDVLLQEQLRDKLLELNLLRPPRVWCP